MSEMEAFEVWITVLPAFNCTQQSEKNKDDHLREKKKEWTSSGSLSTQENTMIH